MRRRAAVLALVLAFVAVAASAAWSPLCPLYDRWDPMWYFLACWESPPNPPEG